MSTLADMVRRATGRSPGDCYQCGCCAAGCFQNGPEGMDVSPTRIMRLLQMEEALSQDPEAAEGYARRALGSETIWLCAGCLACTERCPQGLDIAGTMDVLRQESLRRGLASRSPRDRSIQALHRSFLNGILRTGRLHEVALVTEYKLRSGNFFQDVTLAPAMLMRGKLNLKPPIPGGEGRRLREAADRLEAGEEKP